jgi:IS5 family transposase
MQIGEHSSLMPPVCLMTFLIQFDLRLLNEARETTEVVVDELFKQDLNWEGRKPRCNRDKARHLLFLAFIKKKKPRKRELREA